VAAAFLLALQLSSLLKHDTVSPWSWDVVGEGGKYVPWTRPDGEAFTTADDRVEGV